MDGSSENQLCREKSETNLNREESVWLYYVMHHPNNNINVES